MRKKKLFLIMIMLTIPLFLQLNIFIDNISNSSIDTSKEIDVYSNSQQFLDSSLSKNKSEEVMISQTSGDFTTAKQPEIAIDGNDDLHIVWADEDDGNFDILYRNYTYSTQTWGDIINLTNTDESDNIDPSIAVDADLNIMVVWLNNSDNNSIQGRFFNYNTKSWNSIQDILIVESDTLVHEVKLAHSGGNNFTMVYSRRDGVYDKINVMDYMFWGASYQWVVPYSVQATTATDRLPDMYFDENYNGHLVFRREMNAEFSIMYCNRSWDSGALRYKFGIYNGILNVTQNLDKEDTEDASFPSVIANAVNNKIHVAWDDSWNATGTSQIRLVNISLDNYVSSNLLDNEVKNITGGTDYHRTPVLSYGLSPVNPSILYTKGDSSDGDLMLKESLDSGIEQFNPDIDDPIQNSHVNYVHDVIFDENHSLHVIYLKEVGFFNYRLFYRKYDVWGPNLNVISPNDDLEWNGVENGNITLEVTTERDTKWVKYEYYNDENKNGLADDGNEWNLIRWVNSSVNEFDWEWKTTENGLMDLNYGILRINATDVNGLDDVKYVKNILIDNNIPQICKINKISDDSQRMVENAPGEDVYLNGIINITCEFEDNASEVQYIELYNGTSLIDSKSTSGNSNNFNFTLDQVEMPDGNYTDLFIKVVDGLNHENQSSKFQRNIIVDNTAPNPSFVDIIEDKHYTDSLIINLTTNGDDINTEEVNFYYYPTGDINDNHSIGPGIYSQTEQIWSILWDLDPFFDIDGPYSIIGQVFDKIGHETNITIDIYIDYTAPSPIIVSPDEDDVIGNTVEVIVQTDIDTVSVSLWNCTTKDGEYTYFRTSNSPSSENEYYRNFTIVFNSIGIEPDSFHYIKANASDGLFSKESDEIRIKTSDNHPGNPTQLTSEFKYIAATVTYNVTLYWESPQKGFDANITSYLIYRAAYGSLVLDRNEINLLNDSEKMEYLGSTVGDKYCVAEVFVEQIYDLEMHDYNYTDSGISAAKYHYIILSKNILGFVSDSSSVEIVSIPEENPVRQQDLSDVTGLRVGYFVFLGVGAVLSLVSISSARSRRVRSMAKEKIEKLDEEKFTEEGEKSFEERLDQIEEIATVSIKEEVGLEEMGATEQAIEEADGFLNLKISDAEMKEEASGPRRCPHCNWIISSTAVKCPRCGKLV
ncbi:MAG: hypothetical protein GF364_17855 [Candidatus Lokiarchaeota archaeon]|nr:hypothetical protein [Candidatus Lokiarchaeota archaeon]